MSILRTSDKAKLRWKLLASCIQQKSLACAEKIRSVSTRQCQDLGLVKAFPSEDDTYGRWSQFRMVGFDEATNYVDVRVLQQTIETKDLIGFNNTGNVCIWPSEEILAHYCLRNRDMFRGKNVCELGAGMTALAGIMLAANVDLSCMHLTDGNKTSVENIDAVIARNCERFVTKDVGSSILVWSMDTNLDGLRDKFDVVIASDCLFFEEAHLGLLHVLQALLKKEGIVVMFAPSRNGSREKFLSLAAPHFVITIRENFDDFVSEKLSQLSESPGYDADRQLPSCIVMQKKEKN